ncbi:MAG: class I SAM-dependent methyltransferase [Sulfuritalea sp.]|nr:class I SAM-dependent methyltransferase [Sulfuritalea sp.]
MTLPEQLFPATLMPDRDWWLALWPDPDATIAVLGIDAGMTVVDLCCGDGYLTAAIARRVARDSATGSVIGVDLDPDLLQQAMEACAGADHCTWIRGNAMDLDQLVTARVDCVLIANTFHGVPDPAGLATAVASILRPGGRFIVVNWHALPRERTPVLGQPRGPQSGMRMAPPVLQGIVEPCGFELDAVVELPPYHYGAVFVA